MAMQGAGGLAGDGDHSACPSTGVTPVGTGLQGPALEKRSFSLFPHGVFVVVSLLSGDNYKQLSCTQE